MRSATLSRNPASLEHTSVMTTPPLSHVPTIRLTTATPSATDIHSTSKPTTTTILAPKPQLDTRKRLVPKKSKLSLLGGGKKEKKDLSDVARRVGAPSPTLGRSFEIYVDPADDPDIGEIVVLKKKKSRVGLNELHWGALGDVTNTGKEQVQDTKAEVKKPASTEAPLLAGDDEKEKWWTRRARKDSKDKPKENLRTKKSKERLKDASKVHSKATIRDSTKQPTKTHKIPSLGHAKSSEPRQRSQSMDAGVLFSAPMDSAAINFISVPMPDDDETPRRGHVRTNTSPSLYGERPTTIEGLTAVSQPSKDGERPKNGSIALRAIRSVRSLARIGSWAQLKNMSTDDEHPVEKKVCGPEKDEMKKKKRERTKSMRSSKSGFEALKNTFGSVRKSIDLTGTIRSVSSQTTAVSTSSDGTLRHSRRHSGASTASTVRDDARRSAFAEPIIGRTPKSSGASTIRWNDQIDTVKKRRSPGSESISSKETKSQRESEKKTSGGRKRPGLASLFPDLGQDSSNKERTDFPVQTVPSECAEGESETSTALLDISCVTSLDSPSRRVRPRPLSEQMLGRSRPRGIIGDKDTGVIRILDDVTTDLACLINRLDLEATPTASPVGESPRTGLVERSRVNSVRVEKPAKKPARQLSMEKLLGSLRSYTHRRKCASTSTADYLGQQIAPWPETKSELDMSAERKDPQPEFRRAESRAYSSPTSQGAAPNLHPLPVASRASPKESFLPPALVELEPPMPASFATFGKSRSNGSEGSITPMKSKARRSRGRGSSASQSGLTLASENDVFMDSKTRPERRETLGSVGSRSNNYDPEDPDYDIPGELRKLLSRQDQDLSYSMTSDREAPSERSMTALPPSPGTPPRDPLPPVRCSESAFRAPLCGELSDFNDDAFIASYDEENETKRSFDFTAELRKLDCSGAADNSSFVVQLEEAFRTPKKYSLRGLGSRLGLGITEIPCLSPLAEKSCSVAHEIALPDSPTPSEAASEGEFGVSSESECLSLDRTQDEDVCMKQPSRKGSRAVFSRSSHGRLDLDFKFGGASNRSETNDSSLDSVTHADSTLLSSCNSRRQPHISDNLSDFETAPDSFAPLSDCDRNQSNFSIDSSSSKAMTLSDIIPPADHETRRYSYSSLSEDESALLKLILANAEANLSDASLSEDAERRSINADRQRSLEHLVTHSRQNSDVSFSGLSSYDERRRGFEYGTSRPAFYPAPAPSVNSSLLVPNAAWRNSILSLGSVSSYGRVTRDGAKNPFDYAVPGRRISEDMSYTVDDTFSFLRQDPVRQRADSGASNYSFDSYQSHLRPDVHQRRNRRQVESIISVTSGPPVSLYNRGFNVGRTTFTWRQRTSSFESIDSGFSARQLGRPGVGDKMFESARELGVPLASIAASPSHMESSINLQTSYDSVIDGDRDQDSLIDDTRRRSLIGSQESLFSDAVFQPRGRAPPQFRPISVYSVEARESPKRDDDTMISMLGGGFVRRRSIRSTLEGSPCARMEKRPQKPYFGKVFTRIPSKDDYDYTVEGSPDKARLISRPSFTSTASPDMTSNNIAEQPLDGSHLFRRQSYASTSSSEAASRETPGQDPNASRLLAYDAHFGGNRMSLARKGLLERQSLENCCLSAEGEDTTNTRQSLVVFRRPEPAARKRSVSTGQATATSVADTPPLSRSRSSSQFTGSQGSIDLDRLNVLLSTSMNPIESDRARLRRRGSGHRRRISEARASRTSSVYETIDETPEFCVALSSSGEHAKHVVESTLAQNLSIPDVSIVRWDNEDVGPALRMIQALQNEARLVVDSSRRQWADTAFSVDALQSFQPPLDPTSWKALLEHSRKNFGPLPPELHGCARRSRTISRPSPYPRVRVFTRPPKIQQALPDDRVPPVPDIRISEQRHPLQGVSMKSNITEVQRWEPCNPLESLLPVSANEKQNGKEGPTFNKNTAVFRTRPGVFSSARKLVPGSAKRNAGKSPRKGKQNKENASQGTSIRAESLRISRPRPMGRPSAIPRAIRV